MSGSYGYLGEQGVWVEHYGGNRNGHLMSLILYDWYVPLGFFTAKMEVLAGEAVLHKRPAERRWSIMGLHLIRAWVVRGY